VQRPNSTRDFGDETLTTAKLIQSLLDQSFGW